MLKTKQIELGRNIAREILSLNASTQPRSTDGTFVPPDSNSLELRSWNQYCKDIGSSRQVINRWLKRQIVAFAKASPVLCSARIFIHRRICTSFLWPALS